MVPDLNRNDKLAQICQVFSLTENDSPKGVGIEIFSLGKGKPAAGVQRPVGIATLLRCFDLRMSKVKQG